MKQRSTFQLSEKDKSTVLLLMQSSEISSELVKRFNLLLALDRGDSPTEISINLKLSRRTVYKWKNRYIAEGLEGLNNKPRSGRPSKIANDTIEKIQKLSSTLPPHKSSHWSIRSISQHVGASEWQVRQILNSCNIKSLEGKKPNSNKHLEVVGRVADIVGLYMSHRANAFVLTTSEPALDHSKNSVRRTSRLSLDKRYADTYLSPSKRNGTAELYATFNTIARMAREHNEQEYESVYSNQLLEFLNAINHKTMSNEKLFIIIDDEIVYTSNKLSEWLYNNTRFHCHCTSSSSSWLNALEGWFARLESLSSDNSVKTSVVSLKKELQNFETRSKRDSINYFTWIKPRYKPDSI